jgi:hypothetical protein
MNKLDNDVICSITASLIPKECIKLLISTKNIWCHVCILKVMIFLLINYAIRSIYLVNGHEWTYDKITS